MKLDISICPTDLECDGVVLDAQGLLSAIRLYAESLHPGVVFTCLQIGHRQGDGWARMDGSDDLGESFLSNFWEDCGNLQLEV